MDATALLTDAARRPLETARLVLRDITDEVLHTMPAGRGNPVAWLVWHAARQADVQLAAISGTHQVWAEQDWDRRLRTGRGQDDFGFGDDEARVADLRIADPADLLAYLEAVTGTLMDHLAALTPDQLDEVVDDSYDPPVTRGVRLVSIIDDATAHLGQAAYARGLVEGWTLGV